jgi:phosphate transport system substrate-binding protein
MIRERLPPSPEQRAEAAENGVTFNLTPLGYDAFVFIVHRDNPVDNLTSEQVRAVRAIYSGEITSWKSITGVDEEIIAYQRLKNSGSQTILERIRVYAVTMSILTIRKRRQASFS